MCKPQIKIQKHKPKKKMVNVYNKTTCFIVIDRYIKIMHCDREAFEPNAFGEQKMFLSSAANYRNAKKFP